MHGKSDFKGGSVRVYLLFLSVFLFTVLLLFSSYTPTAEAVGYGDLNEDGSVDVRDVVKIMRHLLELDLLPQDLQVAADVNGDGIVDINDVVIIKRYVLGLIEEFPIAELDVIDMSRSRAVFIGFLGDTKVVVYIKSYKDIDTISADGKVMAYDVDGDYWETTLYGYDVGDEVVVTAIANQKEQMAVLVVVDVE